MQKISQKKTGVRSSEGRTEECTWVLAVRKFLMIVVSELPVV